MRLALLMILASLASTPAPCQEPRESLSFAIYRISDDGRSLIAEGTRDYTTSDIDIIPWGKEVDGYQERRKMLSLDGGFSIGIVVTRQHEADGFGLWIQDENHPDGFSWEWFTRDDGDIFRKLQSKGTVRVTHTPVAKGVEIRSVEFLTDVTLRFMEDMSLPTGTRTHEVVVSRGSVFRVAP